jgi:hypothetical protein
MTLQFPVPISLTLGRAKQREQEALTVESKDFAICCLGLALLFATLAILSLAVQR